MSWCVAVIGEKHFQTDGSMSVDTVTHQEYSGKRGERYETIKPKDSNILRGDGSFLSETDKSAEYKPKKGERYEAVKRGSDDIWKVELFILFFGLCIPFQSYYIVCDD